MAKDHLIDFPDFDPGRRVVFPPTGPATDGRDIENREKAEKPRYSESYDPDPRAANPGDTSPSAPDIRQPFLNIEDEQALQDLSPAPQWKDDPRR